MWDFVNSLVMSLLNIVEVFSYGVTDLSAEAKQGREQKWCRFRNGPCTKGGLKEPLGVCSFGDGLRAGAVCPTRFVEGDRIFRDVGATAFGPGAKVLVALEICILNIAGKRTRRIGKIDYILAKLDVHDQVCDFAALEVQAVYFSGGGTRPAFDHFLKTGVLPDNAARRLDYRSSGPKRLMPQLGLKVPVFRRWGKKFFVAIDSLFHASLPPLKTVESFANSEVTWLIYPFERTGESYAVGAAQFLHTTWEDVLTAFREGEPPTPEEIMEEISQKKAHKNYKTLLV